VGNDDRAVEGTIPLSDEARALEVLRSSVFGLWKTVDSLTKLRPTRKARYEVTIFGSARVEPGHEVYGLVRDLAAGLTHHGCDIVTGGGPGLMQAANEGAARAGADTRSLGIRIELPFEQDANPFVGQNFDHGTFFTRLHHFALRSDAFVAVPGGIGTVLEVMMVWQLLQVGKLGDTPLLLAGPMWEGLVGWCRAAMLRPEMPLASPRDLDLPRVVTSSDEILAILGAHHAAWKRGAPTP
jgi:uncharacterized protein (TIGR00730 family)